MKTHPRNREAKLYIKADARAPFASVEQVLAIGCRSLFETPVLLTSQGSRSLREALRLPKGWKCRSLRRCPLA